MNHFRVILIIQLYWILSAVSRLVGYFTQTSWLIAIGFGFTLHFHAVGDTTFYSLLSYSLFSFVGYLGLTYLALIILSSNSNHLVVKLHRTVPGLIYLSIAQVLTLVIGFSLDALSVSNQLGWFLLINRLVYYLFMIMLVFITIQALLIRVWDRRQRFYKWFFIIYPPITYYAINELADLSRSYYSYAYPDLYQEISTTMTGLLISVFLFIFVLVLQGITSKDLDDHTNLTQLTYPQASQSPIPTVK